MTAPQLPEPRPVLWPLRPLGSAAVWTNATNGRTVVTIRHSPLSQVTPEMLAWWYGHVPGTMRYAGQIVPRYLVWHPLDHISYETSSAVVEPGTRLHITEALGRDVTKLIDIQVTVETIDTQAAIISKRLFGTCLIRLENEFTPYNGGTRYITRLTLGDTTLLGGVVLNRIAHTRAFPPAKLAAWIRHHIEEVGNLENFLPDLFRYRSDHEP
ncbi:MULTISPECIES: DAPG hydrolase family protein [unclassified Kribbella]|uniref:DAPG hydrolase family protein n=1 Tax=unclassified Kribbella TaxID=2644121 RepID=UPI0033EDFF56